MDIVKELVIQEKEEILKNWNKLEEIFQKLQNFTTEIDLIRVSQILIILLKFSLEILTNV